MFIITIEVLFWPKLVILDRRNNPCFTLPLVGATKQPRTLLKVSFHVGHSPTKILDNSGSEVFTCS